MAVAADLPADVGSFSRGVGDGDGVGACAADAFLDPVLPQQQAERLSEQS